MVDHSASIQQGPDDSDPASKIGKILPTPKVEPGNSGVTETSHAVGQELKYQFDFALRAHSYVNDYIRFADQKAAFIFTISSGLLVFFLQRIPLSVVSASAPSDKFFFGLMAVILSLSVVFSFFVVKPRLFPRKLSGLLFWESVANYGVPEAYVKTVTTSDGQTLLSEIIDHHFQLSCVCKRKYTYLAWSIFFLAGGVLLAMLNLLLFNRCIAK